MTLHQALQSIWRLAGLAILWWGVLAVSISGLIAAAAWRRFHRSLERGNPPPPFGRPGFDQVTSERGVLDLATEAEVVLRGLQGLATQQLVRLEMAVEPGLAVQVDRHAFRDILEALARSAIEQSPCGCILLTAARAGCGVHASVSDDGPGADGAVRLARLREAARVVELQRGSMEINARPGEGTTVTVCLPGSDPDGSATNADSRDPASRRTEPRNTSRADNIAH